MADINMATIAYMLGIISIVMAFFSPVAALIFGIIGLVQSKRQKIEKARKLNRIGVILSIIFTIINIVLLIYSGLGVSGSLI